MGLGQFIYDYQTLIVGAGAIGAAYVAAKPVWRQLELTQTQANGVLREMLLQRQAELKKAQEASTEKVGKIVNDLADGVEVDGHILRISEHDAHHFDMGIYHAASWLEHDYPWHDGVGVRAAKKTLIAALLALSELLGEVHRPVSTDQHGDDYSISDPDWADLVARGEAAKDEVPESVSKAHSAYREFLTSLDDEKTIIDTRLRKVNEALAKA